MSKLASDTISHPEFRKEDSQFLSMFSNYEEYLEYVRDINCGDWGHGQSAITAEQRKREIDLAYAEYYSQSSDMENIFEGEDERRYNDECERKARRQRRRKDAYRKDRKHVYEITGILSAKADKASKEKRKKRTRRAKEIGRKKHMPKKDARSSIEPRFSNNLEMRYSSIGKKYARWKKMKERILPKGVQPVNPMALETEASHESDVNITAQTALKKHSYHGKYYYSESLLCKETKPKDTDSLYQQGYVNSTTQSKSPNHGEMYTPITETKTRVVYKPVAAPYIMPFSYRKAGYLGIT